MIYRLVDRTFSRVWRRSKVYREHEIFWLARKRGLEVRRHNRNLELFNPKTGELAACFKLDNPVPL